MTSYLVPTDEKPSIFNKSAASFGLAGSILGIPGIIGGVIGGSAAGYYKASKEQKEGGRVVGEPTAWNEDAALGAGVGMLGGRVVSAVAGFAAIASGSPALALSGLALNVVLFVGAPIIGGIIGGKIGKGRMEREYAEAEQLAAQGKAKVLDGKGHVIDVAKQPSVSVAHDVPTPAAQPTEQEPTTATHHAARIREQQAAQQTVGRGV